MFDQVSERVNELEKQGLFRSFMDLFAVSGQEVKERYQEVCLFFFSYIQGIDECLEQVKGQI